MSNDPVQQVQPQLQRCYYGKFCKKIDLYLTLEFEQVFFIISFLAEGLNIQEILDDIKKLKATVKKQGRRIAHLESICGIESTKSKRDGENV